MTSCTSVTVGKIRSEFEWGAMVLSRQATFQHQKAANLKVIAVPFPIIHSESNSYRRKGNAIRTFFLKRITYFGTVPVLSVFRMRAMLGNQFISLQCSGPATLPLLDRTIGSKGLRIRTKQQYAK